MNHSLTKQPGRSRLLIISTLLLVMVAVLCIPLRPIVGAAPTPLAAPSAIAVPARQDKERVLLPLLVEEGRQSPMQVVAARVGDKRVEPGRPFTAGEEWYRDLTLTLENVSDEPISYVEVALIFDAPEGSPYDQAAHPLKYGTHPSWRVRSAAPERVQVVQPGESVELKVAESDLPTLTRLLAEAGVRPEVDQVKFDIRAIGFERDPDLLWMYGYLMRKNAAEPSKFDNVGRYTLTKKEGLR